MIYDVFLKSMFNIFSLKDGRGQAEVADRRLRPDEAAHPLEVGDGGHGG